MVSFGVPASVWDDSESSNGGEWRKFLVQCSSSCFCSSPVQQAPLALQVACMQRTDHRASSPLKSQTSPRAWQLQVTLILLDMYTRTPRNPRRIDKEREKDSQFLRRRADLRVGLPRSMLRSRHGPVVQAQVAVASLAGRISRRRIFPPGHRW